LGPRASLYLLVLDKKQISHIILLLREDALTDSLISLCNHRLFVYTRAQNEIIS